MMGSGGTAADPMSCLAAWLRQEHVLAMGVSIHTGQGAHLQQVLNVQAFPFIALLQPNTSSSSSRSNSVGNTSLNLLLRAEGSALMEWMDPPSGRSGRSSSTSSAPRLLPHLQSCLTRHCNALAEQETRRLLRQQEMELRRQQDEEYQAALLADQERERQQELEREAERRRIQEQEEAERKQREMEQAALDKAKALIRPEPKSGGTVVRFVLPTGAKVNRRFMSDETVAALRAFLTLHFRDEKNKMTEITNIGLSTNFPRRTYNDPSDDELTLQDAGLSPQAVLMVQDLDA